MSADQPRLLRLSPKTACIGFIACILLFSWFTWPLPEYIASGKISSHRPEIGPPRSVIAGDHLQLMYHFELMKGFLAGETPWFHNLYEFNTGNDAETKVVDWYYIPFSLVYALFSMAGQPALGWNIASLFSVIIGAWGTWLLAGSFRPPKLIQIAATLLATALPYRWLTLLHGSPTGFAVMYVPWILLGLRLAIVDRRASGGWIAGAAFLMSAWGDIHTFFFSALLIPVWSLLMFFTQDKPSLRRKEIKALLWSLRGMIVFGVLVIFQVLFIRAHLSDGSMSGGRTVEEVALFSPSVDALFSPDPDHAWNRIYLTFSGVALLIVGAGFMITRLRRTSETPTTIRHFSVFIGVVLAISGVVILSLGPSIALGWGPRWWAILCRVIPPYEMIRQPAKVYSILPSLFAAALVLPFAGTSFSKKSLPALIGLLTVFLLFESAGRIDPTISLLDKENAAYGTIRSSAEAYGEEPRALAIVLWPGDSHWGSLYQHYAIQYRIRLVNGYRPHVPEGYKEEIFVPFSPLNQGWSSDEMIDDLLSRGIRFLLLHEDAFPEQVSPFDVGSTIKELLAHPRIKLLTRDQAVWSFELRDSSPENVTETEWAMHSPSMLWPLAWDGPKPEEGLPLITPQPDPTAFRGHFAQLTPETSSLRISPYPTFYRPNLRLGIRARGNGTLVSSFRYAESEPISTSTSIDSEDWQWIDLPFPSFEGFQPEITTTFSASEGTLELDAALMQAGNGLLGLEPGETVFLPAPSLFHAGHTDLSDSTVVMSPKYVPHDEVLYGPRLPLSPGRYRVQFDLSGGSQESPAGRIRIREPASALLEGPSEIVGDGPAEFVMTVEDTLPVIFGFTYYRNSEIRIKGITLERIPDE